MQEEFASCPQCYRRFLLPYDKDALRKHLKSHVSLRPKIERVQNWVWRGAMFGVFRAESLYERQLIVDLISRAKKHNLFFRMQSASSLRKYFITYGLIVTTKEAEVIGYALWNYVGQGNSMVKQAAKRGKRMALRQISTVEKLQRKGYGKALIEICLKDLGIQGKWAVESPNYAFLRFLVKHGYAHKSVNEQGEPVIVGDKVTFFSAG